MASIAQSFPVSNRPLAWLWEWLREELTPYPGRGFLVARMVTAATLVMIAGMTFRIPFTFQGCIYALMISRDSPRATLQSATIICVVTGIGAAYILLLVPFVINVSVLHFVWIIFSFFLAFYVISAIAVYAASVIFAIMIAIAMPLWDRHVSAETNVEDTLWLCLAVLIAAVITAGVELAFAQFRPRDEVLSLMTERLSTVENVLTHYADGHAPDPATEQKVTRLAILGTSMLRRILGRSNVSTEYSPAIASIVVLVGRLVDLAATLTPLRFEHTAVSQRRFRKLASTVAEIRNDLIDNRVPDAVHFGAEGESGAAVPLVDEIEHTVTLIPQAFADSYRGREYVPSAHDVPQSPLLSRDAFTNPQHLLFALKGCLAAGINYAVYDALAWPGISTAVTTCLLTALSTVGASHQKQTLRIAGAITGGFVVGMGAQLFILPHIDSIGGFVVLFALVTALSSWVMTASPRLSYFGFQIAIAFYLIHVQEFKIQTSLTVARDRVVGILLGLFMMWLVFDRLWTSPASVEMKRAFVSNLRLMAEFARQPLSADLKVALGRSLALRETINASLDRARALADLVLFEFGPSRRRDLEIRSYIRRWQPQLRTLFVLRIAFLKYRLQLPGFELPDLVRLRQQAYDEHSARMLEEMAGRVEHNTPYANNTVEDSHEILKRTVEAIQGEPTSELPAGRAQSFVTLLRDIDGLTTYLSSEIAGGRWQAE